MKSEQADNQKGRQRVGAGAGAGRIVTVREMFKCVNKTSIKTVTTETKTKTLTGGTTTRKSQSRHKPKTIGRRCQIWPTDNDSQQSEK